MPELARAAGYEDRTAAFERDILKEHPPRVSYLTRLFLYVFSSAKGICGLFLGLSIVLSLLQPAAALLWGRYIDRANALSADADVQAVRLASLVGLAVLYWAIGFVNHLLERYLYGSEEIERLSKVQDHRLQEKFQAKLFRKIARLYPEYTCLSTMRVNRSARRSQSVCRICECPRPCSVSL